MKNIHHYDLSVTTAYSDDKWSTLRTILEDKQVTSVDHFTIIADTPSLYIAASGTKPYFTVNMRRKKIIGSEHIFLQCTGRVETLDNVMEAIERTN